MGALSGLCERNERGTEETRQRLGKILERRGEMRKKKSAREKKKTKTKNAVVKVEKGKERVWGAVPRRIIQRGFFVDFPV